MTPQRRSKLLSRVKDAPITGCDCGCCVSKSAAVKGGETVPKDDHFIKEELELAATLLGLWEDAVHNSGIVDSIILAGSTHNTHVIDTALDNADVSLSQTVVTDEDVEETKKPILQSFLVGFGLAGASAVAASRMWVGINRVLNGYNNFTKYYANQYFARIAHPYLIDAVTRAGNDLHGETDMVKVLKEAMGTVLENTPTYWRTVANQVISRSHHYGILRGGQEQGKLGYRLVAVLDEKTTELCQELNGREFWIADAIEHLEKIADLDDPEDVKVVSPWVKVEDVRGKSSSELVAMGVMVPPFHGNCRTTLVTIHS